METNTSTPTEQHFIESLALQLAASALEKGKTIEEADEIFVSFLSGFKKREI